MITYTLTIRKSNPKVLALLNLIRETEEVELSEDHGDIPAWQKRIVIGRIETTDSKDYLSQEDFETSIRPDA